MRGAWGFGGVGAWGPGGGGRGHRGAGWGRGGATWVRVGGGGGGWWGGWLMMDVFPALIGMGGIRDVHVELEDDGRLRALDIL